MLKKIFIIISLVLGCIMFSYAQLAIPETYELDTRIHRELEINCSDKGVKLPKLSTIQIAAISQPAEGLVLFDKDLNKVIYYNGTRWETPKIIRIYKSKVEMNLDMSKIDSGSLAQIDNKHFKYDDKDWVIIKSKM